MPPPKTILFCPLDWGLGHIARDLPLIREFNRNGHRVVVAASKRLCKWLESEEPGIKTVFFDGPQIHYSGKKGAFSEILFQLPKLMRWPGKEKKRIRKLTEIFHPDLIISDNRYGARHSGINSVIITHQICIQLPRILKWTEYLLHLVVKYLIGKFDQCWIPDYPEEDSLAGKLVHQYPLPSNAVLIGPLSRFDSISQGSAPNTPQKNVLGIISGPEPQRSIFEELLKKKLAKLEGKHTLISGKTNRDKTNKETANPVSINHRPTQEMIRLIQNHKFIISRSGYSTIMDMYFLNRNIIMVPTPGQTEQIYLAQLHHGRMHHKINQNQIIGPEFLNTINSRKEPFTSSKRPLNFRSVLKSILQNPDQITRI